MATTTISKLDLRKEYRELYKPPSSKVVAVEVPELWYIAIDGMVDAGVGPGDSKRFKEDIAAMYGVAYTLKFMSKLREEDPIDFTVMSLEGLWSTESGRFDLDDMEGWYAFGTKEPWLYTLLMLQPDHITREMFEEAVAQAGERSANPSLTTMRLERWREGPAIQIMHIGAYSDEPHTIRLMNEFADEHGLTLHGRHHEIYIGNPQRAKPENLKTILRHPTTGMPAD